MRYTSRPGFVRAISAANIVATRETFASAGTNALPTPVELCGLFHTCKLAGGDQLYGFEISIFDCPVARITIAFEEVGVGSGVGEGDGAGAGTGTGDAAGEIGRVADAVVLDVAAAAVEAVCILSVASFASRIEICVRSALMRSATDEGVCVGAEREAVMFVEVGTFEHKVIFIAAAVFGPTMPSFSIPCSPCHCFTAA